MPIYNPPPVASGGGPDAHYVHVQGAAATTWTIVHNLGKHPALTVVDSGGNRVYGDEVYVSTTTTTVTFGAAFGGVAYAN